MKPGFREPDDTYTYSKPTGLPRRSLSTNPSSMDSAITPRNPSLDPLDANQDQLDRGLPPQATTPQATTPQATTPQATTPQTTTPQAQLAQDSPNQHSIPQSSLHDSDNYDSDENDTDDNRSKKPSAQEINEEIDLKKNRNRSISAVLAGCAVVPMVVLGLMAFGVINVSSLVLFPGYGASEVVLGLVGISALSQVSLAFASNSGISKVEEKKPRVFDGVNPSVEQDIHDRKLRDEREKKKQEELQGRSDNKTPNWQEKLESQRRLGGSQRGL